MNFYDSKLIMERTTAQDVAEKFLGLKIADNRTAATWRGGTNPKSVSFNGALYYDHSAKVGGNLIQLVTLVRNVNFAEACELLGEWLHLDKTVEISEGRRKVAEYIYTNEKDEPVHKTVRYNLPDGDKEFCQYRYEKGEWVAGLGDVTTLPYHVKNLTTNQQVYIHEGEKSCDCAIQNGITNSTSLPMGAGKWETHYLPYFVGRDVVIVRDNDDAGYAHGERLAWELRNTAKSIRKITPSKITKGDAYEYFHEESGTKDRWEKMVLDSPAIDVREINEPKESKDDQYEIDAKSLNKTAFKNYIAEETGKKGKDGKSEKQYHARGVKELISELRIRLLGFPKKCGGKLFDVDKRTQKHMEINDAIDMCAWMMLKTGHTPIFRESIGFVTAKMFFQALYRESEEFELISDMPHYPPLDNVYYLKRDMPKPTPDHHYFNEFCKFFHGETYEDSLLIKICVASLFYYEYKSDKPMWIFDVAPGSGQGVGKTKAVEMMAYLLNSEPFWISPNLFKVSDITTQLNRRLLSMDGRRKRVFVIDNVETFFKSPELASYITQGSFSGMAPYGKGETSRINDLNFFITSNKGTFDTDIIIRSFIVHLQYKKERDDNWITSVKNFVQNHRFQISSEVIDILKNNSFRTKARTRFKVWEQAVLMPIVGNQADFDAVINIIRERGAKSDGELERAEILNDFIYNKIRDLRAFHPTTNESINPDTDFIFCESYVLMKWAQEAIPNMGGKMGGSVMHLLRQMANSNPSFILSSGIEKFPIGKSMTGQKRGMMWRGKDFLLKLATATPETKKTLIQNTWVLSIATDKTNEGKSFQTVQAKTWGATLREIEERKARESGETAN